MTWRDDHLAAEVVAPTQSADDGHLAWQHELLQVSVKVGELEAKVEEQLVPVRPLVLWFS
jgi:hypothetical protein